MYRLVTIHRNSYKDSVRLLEAARAMLTSPGVKWSAAFMATPANMATLEREGFAKEAYDIGPNDLIVAVCAESECGAAHALDAASNVLFRSSSATKANEPRQAADLRSALGAHPRANVALISAPGPFAALEAHKALTAGLHVFLFSDNVPLADEIELKRRAREVGRFVMGPGAGTAMLGGVGLGFSNRVKSGPVGIVAAAGTGAQEVMSLLDRWDAGVSHAIGVGGRDLSDAVGGMTAEMAIRALDADSDTSVILLVSKPPSREVTTRLLSLSNKPIVAALMGFRGRPEGLPAEVEICDTLEDGALRTLSKLGMAPPSMADRLIHDLRGPLERLSVSRRRIVGLYSGGTLCYEAMVVLSRRLGPIYSNIPLDPRWTLSEAPLAAHVCLDLGEEEFTKGRPHPIIDVDARADLLRRQADDPTVAAVLLDVVIGDSAHPDPASVLAPIAANVVRSGAAVIAYVLGTSRDPQGLEAQRAAFRRAGCVVASSNARAAYAAMALAMRDPSIATEGLPSHVDSRSGQLIP